MTSHRVSGLGPRTSFAEYPTVTFQATPDQGPVSVTLEFDGELLDEERRRHITRVVFDDVLELRWIESRQYYVPTDQGEHAFALIEITDSERVERMKSMGPHRELPQGERLGLLRESDLRHFRIGFDEHGTYDVLCTEITIERYKSDPVP